MEKPRRFRRLSPCGPTFELLAILFVCGSRSMCRDEMHPWLRVAAVHALRRGLVEVAIGDLTCVANADDADASVIRIASAGRVRLGLPDPAALGDRDSIDVLAAGVLVAYGYERWRIQPCSPTPNHPQLIARVVGPDDAHASLWWFADVAARYASEQGVPCRCVRGHNGQLLGFESIGAADVIDV